MVLYTCTYVTTNVFVIDFYNFALKYIDFCSVTVVPQTNKQQHLCKVKISNNSVCPILWNKQTIVMWISRSVYNLKYLSKQYGK